MLLGVMTVHLLQDPAASWLNRKMQMFTDFFWFTHHFNQFIWQILRMWCHETDSFQSFDLLNLLKKLCKCDRFFQILSIGVNILSKQHDFYNEAFNLTDDCLRITASLTSTYIRYDTVTAEIVASEHDVYTGFKRIFSFYRKIFNNLVSVLPDVNNCSVRLHCRC